MTLCLLLVDLTRESEKWWHQCTFKNVILLLKKSQISWQTSISRHYWLNN